MLSHLSYRWFEVYRPSAWVVEREAVAAVRTIAPVTVQIPALVEVELWGSVLTGSITIEGELAGVGVNETITITGPVGGGRVALVTSQRFDVLTGYSSTGLATESPVPEARLRAVDTDGGAIPSLTRLGSVRAMIDAWRGDWRTDVHGSAAVSRRVIGHDPCGWRPRRGDVYVEQIASGRSLTGGPRWEVVSVEDHLGAFRPTHFEVDVRELPASAT